MLLDVHAETIVAQRYVQYRLREMAQTGRIERLSGEESEMRRGIEQSTRYAFMSASVSEWRLGAGERGASRGDNRNRSDMLDGGSLQPFPRVQMVVGNNCSPSPRTIE